MKLRTFCRAFCGQCGQCQLALLELKWLDGVYETLSNEEAASLLVRDSDDPLTYALNHKGQP